MNCNFLFWARNGLVAPPVQYQSTRIDPLPSWLGCIYKKAWHFPMRSKANIKLHVDLDFFHFSIDWSCIDDW